MSNQSIHATRTGVWNDTKPVRCDAAGRLVMGGSIFYLEFVDGGAGAYALHDSVGTKQTLAAIAAALGAALVIDSMVIIDDAGASPALTLLLFQAGNPTGTDNAAFAWNGAGTQVTGKISVTPADWALPAGAGAAGIATLSGLNLVVAVTAASQDLIAILVADAAYTLGAGKKVRIYLGVR